MASESSRRSHSLASYLCNAPNFCSTTKIIEPLRARPRAKPWWPREGRSLKAPIMGNRESSPDGSGSKVKGGKMRLQGARERFHGHNMETCRRCNHNRYLGLGRVHQTPPDVGTFNRGCKSWAAFICHSESKVVKSQDIIWGCRGHNVQTTPFNFLSDWIPGSCGR